MLPFVSLCMQPFTDRLLHKNSFYIFCRLLYLLQSRAVMTWSNIVRYCKIDNRNSDKISIRCWIYKRHPVFLLWIFFLENLPCYKALHCIHMDQGHAYDTACRWKAMAPWLFSPRYLAYTWGLEYENWYVWHGEVFTIHTVVWIWWYLYPAHIQPSSIVARGLWVYE